MDRHAGTLLCSTQFLENYTFLGFFLSWRVLGCMLFFSLIIDYFVFYLIKMHEFKRIGIDVQEEYIHWF
jgi:hypothetical protein